jgi:hypothetical protein
MKVNWRSALMMTHVLISGVFGASFLVMPLIVLMPIVRFVAPDAARLFRAWSDCIQGKKKRKEERKKKK